MQGKIGDQYVKQCYVVVSKSCYCNVQLLIQYYGYYNISYQTTADLQCYQFVINYDFFRQKIGTNCCFILVTELLVHKLAHQRCLTNPTQ